MGKSAYLTDHAFLQRVAQYRVTTYYADITVRDFATEHPLAVIQGKVVSGTINVTTGSTRRTGSLTIVFDKSTFDLVNPDNLIAVNKKIGLSIGINNPFWGHPERWGGAEYEGSQWEQYPDILLFPQGVFILTAANSSVSATSATVSINFIDKMGMLNGTCGGTIPASISLHDKWIIDGDGNVTVEYPLIRQIIEETVHHFGGEHPGKIIINDLPTFGRSVVRYMGSTPIHFAGTAAAPQDGGFVISPDRTTGFGNSFYQGDDIGYMARDLTFPGELTKGVGSTVEAILTAICNALGNYEFFYDINGDFIFQRIRHFEMTGEAPLSATRGLNSPFNISSELDQVFQDGFMPRFSDNQFINEFMNADLVSSANHNPQYQLIKNDFVVWGTRQRDGEDSVVRMRLAVDQKPRERLTEAAIPSDILDTNGVVTTEVPLPQEVDHCLCYKWIWEVRDADNMIVTYLFRDNGSAPSGVAGGIYGPFVWVGDDLIGKNNATGYTVRLHSPSLRADDRSLAGTLPVGPPLASNQHAGIRNGGGTHAIPYQWREELYRMALRAHGTSTEGSAYDMELRAEWREIFDPNNDLFFIRWREHFGPDVRWSGYKREIVTDPSTIRYWLDFLDINSSMGQYSVNRIGRRTIAEDNSQIHEVLNRQVPSMLFIDGAMPAHRLREAVREQQTLGQRFTIINQDLLPLFQFRNSFGSCYETIRNLMHRHLIYNASVTVQSQPIFYLDVNRVIRLNFPDQGIVGNFVINRLSWNLGGAPRMSLTANEAVVIV